MRMSIPSAAAMASTTPGHAPRRSTWDPAMAEDRSTDVGQVTLRVRYRPAMPQPSRFLINTGTGKGKTSAAMGVMGRAWARGWTVCVVQFVKSEKWKVGERKLAEHLAIEWFTLGDGFTWESTDLDETAAKGRHAWVVAAERIASGDYDLVILDEATYIVKYGWAPVGELVDAISN